MTQLSTVPGPDDAILLQFQQEHEAADDKKAVLARYCTRYPHLVARLRARAGIVWLLSPPPEDPLPDRFGEYRVVRRIGGGGMGRVYEARHDRLNRRAAVKTIRPDRASPGLIDRFRREQRALARLHQTHIVSIYEAGEAGPVDYFAMPYIDGAALSHVVQSAWQFETGLPRGQTPSLAKLAMKVAAEHDRSTSANDGDPSSAQPTVPAEGPAPAPAARTAKLTLSAEYFRSVAEAMADAAEAIQHTHDAGLLHRDVKPSNLMVDRHGHCWVIDYGLAGQLVGRNGKAAATDPVLSAEPVTATGLLGTPQYMAPEQWARPEGAAPDARADVWGLGVTLYELLTLRRAFDGESIAKVRAKVVEAKAAPVEELTTNVPPDLAAVCRKAMQKEPQARYATAREFADDLRRWLRHEPTKALGARPWRRMWLWGRRNPGWAAACGVALFAFVALAAGAGLYHERYQEAERQSLIRQAQDIRVKPHAQGWRSEAGALLQKGAKIRADEVLRDQAAATLTGIDAVTEAHLKRDAGALAFSPDGKRVVVGGTSPTWRGPTNGGVYDRAADRFMASQQPGLGPVAFAADGTALQLVATGPYTLRVWDVDRQRPVREFAFDPKLPPAKPAAGHAPALALSADGSLVAASALLPDGKPVLRVWDVATGNAVAAAERRATILAFSPDKALLAAATATGEIVVHEVRSGKEMATLPGDRQRVNALAFTRDPVRRRKEGRDASGWLLAAGGAGGSLTLWDVACQRERMWFFGCSYDVYGVAFSPDGTLLASAGRDNPLLWDVATGQRLLKLDGQSFSPGVAFSADGQSLAVSAIELFSSGGVDVYALDHGQGVQTLRGLRGRVEKTCRSPDGLYLAAFNQQLQLGVWDLTTGRLLHIFEMPAGFIADNVVISLSADHRLVCASWREAKMWDVRTGQELREWKLPPGLVNVLTFDPQGRLLLLRMETEDMKHAPNSGTSPFEHPRVCRVRNLLAKNPAEQILFDLHDFNIHVFHAACPADGSCWVVDGVRGTRDKQEHGFAVYDGLTGKVLWDQTYEADPGQHASLHIDPTGKLLRFQLPKASSGTVVELRTARLRGPAPAGNLGPGAEWRLEGGQYGHGLYRAGEKAPLVTLGIDTLSSGALEQAFNAAGTHLAWGNADGTVSVYDVQEIRKRLAAVGLGW